MNHRVRISKNINDSLKRPHNRDKGQAKARAAIQKHGPMQMQALSSSSSSLGLVSSSSSSSSVGIPLSIRFKTSLSYYTPPTRWKKSKLPSRPMASINSINNGGSPAATVAAPKWAQKIITIPAQKRGCHLITSKILREIGQDVSQFECGLAHLFLQHTSASLTINENYDSDVRDDTETFLNKVVPEGESAPWKHVLEGPDDMPAHIKSSMFGCALMVPITNGKLNIGTWQGIWLCEHRDYATPRQIVVTLNGI